MHTGKFRWLALMAILGIGLFALAASTTQSETDAFDFERFRARLMDESELTERALDYVEGAVRILEVTEQVAMLVPMGGWYGSIGVIPSSNIGNPDEPIFVLALRGSFTQDAPDDPNARIGPSFTVTVNAFDGSLMHYTGAFRDPRAITGSDMIEFPPPVTLAPEIAPEITAEPSGDLRGNTNTGDGFIPLPPSP
jgi:hypothetical protein